MTSPTTGPVLKTILFAILIPGIMAVLIPYLLLEKKVPWPVTWVGWLALAPTAAGALILIWCARDFAIVGRGTPAPIDPPKLLVASGPYRYVRNPMYWGVEGVLWGEALCFRSTRLTVYALLMGLGFHLFVMLYEEPTLRKKFGTSYDEYRRAVPRWIPRSTPWSREA